MLSNIKLLLKGVWAVAMELDELSEEFFEWK